MTHRRQARLTKAQRRILRLVARAEYDFLEQRSPIYSPDYQFRHDGEIFRKLCRRGYAYSCARSNGRWWYIGWMLNAKGLRASGVVE
jgi:hypothetical protein